MNARSAGLVALAAAILGLAAATTCDDGADWDGGGSCATCVNATYCAACASGWALNATYACEESPAAGSDDYDLGDWILVLVGAWGVILLYFAVTWYHDYRRHKAGISSQSSMSFRVRPAASGLGSTSVAAEGGSGSRGGGGSARGSSASGPAGAGPGAGAGSGSGSGAGEADRAEKQA